MTSVRMTMNWCSNTRSQFEYICKLIIGFCILKKIIGNRTLVTAKAAPIGSKRKVGMPRKAALALIRLRQFTSLLDQSFSHLADEIDIVSESINR